MQMNQNYSGLPIVTTSKQLGEFNFGDFFDKVAGTATAIYTAKAAADAQKQAYKLEQQRIAAGMNYNSNFDFSNPNSPIYGGGLLPQSSFPIAPVLLFGGLGLAAYLLLSRK
jgi:hypothetical protein